MSRRRPIRWWQPPEAVGAVLPIRTAAVSVIKGGDERLPRAKQRPGVEEHYLAAVVSNAYRIIAWFRRGLIIEKLSDDPIHAILDRLKDHEWQVPMSLLTGVVGGLPEHRSDLLMRVYATVCGRTVASLMH